MHWLWLLKTPVFISNGTLLLEKIEKTAFFNLSLRVKCNIKIMPGMIARILFTSMLNYNIQRLSRKKNIWRLFVDDVACANPESCKIVCGNHGGCTNLAYPKLVMELLPTGARGVMVGCSRKIIIITFELPIGLLFYLCADSSYDGRTHVVTHEYIQFDEHNIHNGHLETSEKRCKRLGTDDCWPSMCHCPCFHINIMDTSFAS